MKKTKIRHPASPTGYLWSVNIDGETVVTVKKKAKRGEQGSPKAILQLYSCSKKLVLLKKVLCLVEIFKIVSYQVISVEMYEYFQRLSIFYMRWDTSPNFWPIVFQ